MRQSEIIAIRCRTDNYAYLVHQPETGRTALFDVPDAAPIRAELDRRGWVLSDIFITHHHDDHISGVDALRQGARVIGNGVDARRLPALDLAVAPGDSVDFGGEAVTVMRADGHTMGQVAYYMPGRAALFSADSLMIHGCGRLFEGSPADMKAALDAFAALPPDTRIWSGHDYAAANLDFARGFAPDAAALAARLQELDRLAAEALPVTGVTLASELLLNPYLRCHLPEVKLAVGMAGASDLEVFAEIRRRKDNA